MPVVALVSDLPARLAPHRYRSAASQALDQASLLAPVTKWQAAVPDAATMPALVRQAFREATSGRPGPVALFLPQDVLDGPGKAESPEGAAVPATSARFGRFPPFRPAPEPADVAAATAALRAARRPFILAGGGVLHSGAGAELTALAEQVSAAVGTTLSGKGAIAEDHPLSVGVTGTMGTAAAAAALGEADVVLLAGCKASGGATFSWTLPRADQAVLQLDLDPAELGRAFPLRAALLGDARAGLAALTAALDDDGGGTGRRAGPVRVAGPAGRADRGLADRPGRRAGQRPGADRAAAGAGRAGGRARPGRRADLRRQPGQRLGRGVPGAAPPGPPGAVPARPGRPRLRAARRHRRGHGRRRAAAPSC